MHPVRTWPASTPSTELNPGKSAELNPGESWELEQTCSFPPGVGLEGGVGTPTKVRSFFKCMEIGNNAVV